MTEDQLLDFADTCAEAARKAEVDLLRVAYQWAVVHSADRLDPAETGRPGREQPRQYGGAGTAPVSEFAAATLGARIGRSPYAAARLIGDAQDLAHRHPMLWGRVQALEVRASYARHVTTRTRDLSPTEAGYVDAAVAESADGRIPWSRFETLVDAKITKAAPAIARAKQERARQATFAKTCGTQAHGMASFLIRADLATITQIDTLVTAVAAALKTALPDSSTDERRVRAIMLLLAQRVPADSPARTATPDPADQATTDEAVAAAGAELAGIDLADLLPTVQLFVHMYHGTSGTEVEVDAETGEPQEPIVRVEGHRPLTRTWVRDVLGDRCRFTITPVLDLAGQAPVDAYEIPDRHRAAVRLMTPADVFPHAASLSRSTEIDHTVPWDPHGPPSHQDPWQLASPAALPRHLPLARPPRRVPPRRPHRHPLPQAQPDHHRLRRRLTRCAWGARGWATPAQLSPLTPDLGTRCAWCAAPTGARRAPRGSCRRCRGRWRRR